MRNGETNEHYDLCIFEELVMYNVSASMTAALLILTGVVVGIVTWWYANFIKWNKYISRFPGPFPFPIIGNAHKFGATTDFIPALVGLQKDFGNIVKVWIGFRPRLIVSDSKFLEFLLGSSVHVEKSSEYHYWESWLGSGLLTSGGDKWKRHRKLLTPTFHFQILQQFVDVFNSQSDILVQKLQREGDEKPLDIFPYVTLCTLDMLCEATMGISVNAQNDSKSEYVQSVKDTCRILMERSFSPIKMWDAIYVFCGDYRREKNCLKILHGYTNSIIKSRKEALTDTEFTTANTDGIKKKLAFLDLLLQCRVDGQPLSDESIRAEADTFMFAGHDTTSSGISFTLYCLAKNPDVQEKVVEELRSIFADDNNRLPTYNDLQEMKYLEMVIKESMRMYPPVPAFGRELKQDAYFDGVLLPKGLAIIINIYSLHYQKGIYPDPEKFDPERFSTEKISSRSAYDYLPFSAGPRNCIGQRFAMLEMKSTVSRVIRNFKLTEVPGHKPLLSAAAVLKSDNELPIYFRER